MSRSGEQYLLDGEHGFVEYDDISSPVLRTRKVGDSQDRMLLRADGTIYVGSGAVPPTPIGDTAWTYPALLNSWTNNGYFANLSYRKDALGFVHIRGGIKTGTNAVKVFSLPAGYLPAAGVNYDFPALRTGTAGDYIEITPAGDVIPHVTSTTLVVLDGIHFLAEA